MKRLISVFIILFCVKANASHRALGNASNLNSGTLDDARLSVNVTTQTNTFNAANRLLKLDGDGKIPAGLNTSSTSANIDGLNLFRSSASNWNNSFSVSSQAFALYFPTASSKSDEYNAFIGTAGTRINQVATDTSTLKSRLDNVAVDTSTLLTALNSTAANTTSRFSNVATDTSTLKTRLDNVATDTSTLLTAINSTAATMTSRFDNVAIDTATLKSRLDNVATDTATILTTLNSTAANTTSRFSNVAIDTSTILTALNSSAATTTAQFLSVANSTQGLRSNLSNIVSTNIASTAMSSFTMNGPLISEGEMELSDVATLDATAARHGFLPKLSGIGTQFLNGNGNFTVPAGGGGGSTTDLTTFTVVVGSLGAVNVDIASDTTDGYTEALSRIYAKGLTLGTSAYGTIIFRGPGVWTMSAATIPAKVHVKGVEGSSVVWKLTSDNLQMVKVYGEISGVGFDMDGRAITGRIIEVSTGGYFHHNEVYNSSNQVAGVYPKVFHVNEGTRVKIQYNKFRDMPLRAGVARRGDSGGYQIDNSTNIEVSYNEFYNGVFNGSVDEAKSGFDVTSSSQVRITHNKFYNVSGTFFVFGKDIRDVWFDYNDMEIVGRVDQGYVNFAAPAGSISTGTLSISHNNLTISAGNVTGSIFYANGGVGVDGLVIDGNKIDVYDLNSFTAISINEASDRNVAIMNNHITGCATFISDMGTGTSYVNNDNFLRGIEQ